VGILRSHNIMTRIPFFWTLIFVSSNRIKLENIPQSHTVEQNLHYSKKATGINIHSFIEKYISVPTYNTQILTKRNVYTYIPLTLYPRRGIRGISDFAPKRPRFTKITYL
jgi:hypothetical protein